MNKIKSNSPKKLRLFLFVAINTQVRPSLKSICGQNALKLGRVCEIEELCN